MYACVNLSSQKQLIKYSGLEAGHKIRIYLNNQLNIPPRAMVPATPYHELFPC